MGTICNLKSRSINQNFWSLKPQRVEHTHELTEVQRSLLSDFFSCEMAYVPPHRRRQLAQPFQALGEKALRACCWDALKVDDPASLLGLLEAQGAAIEGGAAGLMLRLELALWKQSNGRGPLPSNRRGLVCVAAGNGAGVPIDGALKCISMLLTQFPNDGSAWTEEQLELAERMARQKGRARAVQLLHCAANGEEVPHQIPSEEIEMPTARVVCGRREVECKNGYGDKGVFDGDVQRGKPVGAGTFTFHTGQNVTGFYNDQGFPCGNILYTWHDGSTPFYKGGRNAHGQAHGRGIKYARSGEVVFDGWWVDGKQSHLATSDEVLAEGPQQF